MVSMAKGKTSLFRSQASLAMVLCEALDDLAMKPSQLTSGLGQLLLALQDVHDFFKRAFPGGYILYPSCFIISFSDFCWLRVSL